VKATISLRIRESRNFTYTGRPLVVSYSTSPRSRELAGKQHIVRSGGDDGFYRQSDNESAGLKKLRVGPSSDLRLLSVERQKAVAFIKITACRGEKRAGQRAQQKVEGRKNRAGVEFQRLTLNIQRSRPNSEGRRLWRRIWIRSFFSLCHAARLQDRETTASDKGQGEQKVE
jgi:hypothetical protein